MNNISFNTDMPVHKTVVNTLAVVGFVALVGAGMWLAVYTTRFVPSVVNTLGEAAVYVGSIFTPAQKPGLAVIPTASTTVISFGSASTTPTETDPVPVSKPKSSVSSPAHTIAGQKTDSTYQISGATTTPVLAGLPDLIVTIDSVGYLATTSADSFIASSTVPAGNRPAVKFTIRNVGTNVAGSWRFSASIPTQTAYIYQSPSQQALNPGDSIDYTLGFDQANKGSDETISITANFDHAVAESNTDNNSASTKVTIVGS